MSPLPMSSASRRTCWSSCDTRYGSLLTQIARRKQIDDEIRAGLKKAIDEFKEQFQASAAAVRA